MGNISVYILKLIPKSSIQELSIDDYCKGDLNIYIPTKEKILFSKIKGVDIELNLGHEIAHFIEIENNRLIKPDFGLISNPNKSIKSIFNSFARESRVCAIESIINGESPYKALHKAAVFSNINMIDVSNLESLTGFKSTDDFEDWIESIVNSTYSSWNQDKVLHILNEKVNYLSNWLETFEI